MLSKAKVHTLFDLLYRCTEVIHEPTTLTRTLYRIKSAIKRKCGLNTLPHFTISYPYDHRVDTIKLKKIVNHVIRATNLTPTIKKHIQLQLRFVSTKRRSIADMLVNAKQSCRTFNPLNPPKCINREQ